MGSVRRELLVLLLFLPTFSDAQLAVRKHTHQIWPSVVTEQPNPSKNFLATSSTNKHFRTQKAEVREAPSFTVLNLTRVTISFQPPFSKRSSQHSECWTQHHVASAHVLSFFSSNICSFYPRCFYWDPLGPFLSVSNSS